MIKLKSLLKEATIDVVAGIIHPSQGIMSKLTKLTHPELGFHHGIKWRYNPQIKAVYWKGSGEDHSKDDEWNVEDHLNKKYNLKVIKHINNLDDTDFVTGAMNIDRSHGLMFPVHQYTTKS